MFLQFSRRFKDGKGHRYWSIVENKRCSGGKVVQRQALYFDEINDGQREAWCQLIDSFGPVATACGSRLTEVLQVWMVCR
jgi:hypothetical protein